MKPKLLGLSIASSALLATSAQAGTNEQAGTRVTLPSNTIIQKALIFSADAALADDDSPNHQSHSSHSSHTSHYSSSNEGGQLS